MGVRVVATCGRARAQPVPSEHHLRAAGVRHRAWRPDSRSGAAAGSGDRDRGPAVLLQPRDVVLPGARGVLRVPPMPPHHQQVLAVVVRGVGVRVLALYVRRAGGTHAADAGIPGPGDRAHRAPRTGRRTEPPVVRCPAGSRAHPAVLVRSRGVRQLHAVRSVRASDRVRVRRCRAARRPARRAVADRARLRDLRADRLAIPLLRLPAWRLADSAGADRHVLQRSARVRDSTAGHRRGWLKLRFDKQPLHGRVDRGRRLLRPPAGGADRARGAQAVAHDSAAR